MPLLRDAALTDAFDRGAGHYDRLVALNPGYHSQLRRSAGRLGLAEGGAGSRVLDLGCGTGASTAALAAAFPAAEIVGVDASAGMLERARAKHWPERVRFVHATAEDLERTEAHGSFDAVLAAYLFRNLTDPDSVLRTVHGLLAPAGRLAVHEYALGGRRADRLMWDAVCRGVILPLGTATGDRDLYRHLWRSVAAFDTAPAFAARLGRAGFAGVRVLPLPGWQTGLTHTFVCRRADAKADGAAPKTERERGTERGTDAGSGPGRRAETETAVLDRGSGGSGGTPAPGAG
ncbi:ubiquinone/menaquinone biosynthesis C-methylase UbiE [Streptomyces sp. BK208]|nr:ubiquinone/menaquinone biosynthesis C-methylase UbiE [Streptomyces sp. BK208]